jgi:6-pyruvoyltetrahydropterin/6-carboxytetrahydropterin synthase
MIWKDVSFEAAHRLPLVPSDHQCARLHGHSYAVRLELEGPVRDGWVQDYAEIKAAGEDVHAKIDHRYLHDVPGLENPTTEILAEWIYRQLIPTLPRIRAVQIQETATCGCRYEYEPRWG